MYLSGQNCLCVPVRLFQAGRGTCMQHFRYHDMLHNYSLPHRPVLVRNFPIRTDNRDNDLEAWRTSKCMIQLFCVIFVFVIGFVAGTTLFLKRNRPRIYRFMQFFMQPWVTDHRHIKQASNFSQQYPSLDHADLVDKWNSLFSLFDKLTWWSNSKKKVHDFMLCFFWVMIYGMVWHVWGGLFYGCVPVRSYVLHIRL